MSNNYIIIMANLSNQFCVALYRPQVQCTCTDSDSTHVQTIANLVKRSLPNANPLSFTIADGGFMCGHNPEQMTFRAKLVATAHRNASVILSYLREWLHSKDIININGAILRLNRMCNLSISSLGADLCDTTYSTATTWQPQGDSETPQPNCASLNLGAILGGVGVALILVIVASIALVAMCHSKCIKRTGR